MSTQVTEAELHAYVDGVLDDERRRDVAERLGRDPAQAALAQAYAADRDKLAAAVAAAGGEALPAAWAQRILAATGASALPPTAGRSRPARAMPPPQPLQRRHAIAAGIALVVGAGTTWRLLRPGRDAVLNAALSARGAVVASADGPALGSTPTEVSARAAIMRRQLGFAAHAPDLQRFGYTLTGLDLLDHAVQLRYRDRGQHRLTIYARASDGTVRFDLLRRGADRICVWQDDVVGAVIIAPLDAGQMMRVASAAYAGFNL